MGPVAALLVALFTAAEPSPAPPQVLIAVPELVPLGVSSELAQNLTAVIAAELGRYDRVRVISSREIAMLLGVERQKELLGCADDSCVSQLAGALGAEKILSGQIGTVEQSVVFTLQLTDVKSARVEGRVVKVVPTGMNQIVDAVRATVTALMGSATSRNQLPRLAVRGALVAHDGETVRLDASRCYDPDGDPLQTEWRQLDGPPALLEGAREALESPAAIFFHGQKSSAARATHPRMDRLLKLVAVLSTCAGCVLATSKEGFINSQLKRAAFDVDCPADQVQVTVLEPGAYSSVMGVEGCGRKATYKYDEKRGWIAQGRTRAHASDGDDGPKPRPSRSAGVGR